MTKRRRLGQLGVGIGAVTMVLGALLALAPGAGADHTDPPGFNGTVKIDGLDTNDGPGHSNAPNEPDDDGTDNDPHVDCGLQLEFFNFDHDEVADLTITVQPPTGKGDVVFSRQDVVVSEDDAGGAGNDLDATIDLRVPEDVDLSEFEAHPKHGWHVKLQVDIFRVLSDGREMVGQKHKVFWIEGCQPTGSISVEKDVTGAGAPDTGVSGEPEYAFTVACESLGEPVDLTPGDDETTTASFSLKDGQDRSFSELPLGAECTITETDWQSAATTTMTVGETVVDDASTPARDGTVTVSSTNTAVVVTNHYPATIVPPTPTELEYSVDVDKLNDADGDGVFSASETAEDAGDDVEFQVTIRNTGTGSLEVEALTDEVPGIGTIDLLGDDVDLVCTSGVVDLRAGSFLPAGSITVCSFELDDYAPDAGDSITNVVTVVTDRDSDTDSSTVDTEEEIVVLPTPPAENPTTTPPPAVAPAVGAPVVAPPQQVVSQPEVRGDVVTRALPRTGDDSRGLIGMGAFLIAVGAAMVLGSRRQLARR